MIVLDKNEEVKRYRLQGKIYAISYHRETMAIKSLRLNNISTYTRVSKYSRFISVVDFKVNNLHINVCTHPLSELNFSEI